MEVLRGHSGLKYGCFYSDCVDVKACSDLQCVVGFYFRIAVNFILMGCFLSAVQRYRETFAFTFSCGIMQPTLCQGHDDLCKATSILTPVKCPESCSIM
jgi:hypothetical protein